MCSSFSVTNGRIGTPSFVHCLYENAFVIVDEYTDVRSFFLSRILIPSLFHSARLEGPMSVEEQFEPTCFTSNDLFPSLMKKLLRKERVAGV